VQAISFVGSTPIAEYIYATGCAHGKRVQALGGAKNHAVVMPDADFDNAVNALMGAAYGSCGERCMAIPVVVAVGDDTAEAVVSRLKTELSKMKVGPGTQSGVDMGPLITQEHCAKVRGYVDLGVKEGAQLVVDGRGLKVAGHEGGYFLGGCLFDRVTPAMKIYRMKFSARSWPWCGSQRSRRRWNSSTPTNMATAPVFSLAMAKPRATSPITSASAWSASTCRCRYPWPITASAAGSARCSATSVLWSRRGALLHPTQDDHTALAVGRRARGSRVQFSE